MKTVSRRQLLLSALPASLLQQPPYTNPPAPIAPHIDTFYAEYKTFEFLAATLIGSLVRQVKRLNEEVPGRGKYPHGGNV